MGRLCGMSYQPQFAITAALLAQVVHSLDGGICHPGNIKSYHDDPYDVTGQSPLAIAA
jgi:hypothetical protein